MHRLALLLGLCLAGAVDALERKETPRFQRFPDAAGVSKPTDIAQDSLGYLWVGTSDGLARYDGVRFRLWQVQPDRPGSLRSNLIDVVLVDRSDRVWVGSVAGLSVLDQAREGFEHVRLSGRDERCAREVTAIAQTPDDSLWFGTMRGELCRLHPDGRLSRHVAGEDAAALPPGSILSLLADAQGRLWIGTGQGLARWHQDRFEPFPGGFDDGHVRGISQDRHGAIWVASMHGVFRVGPDDEVEALYPELDEAIVNHALQDREGRRWFATSFGLHLDGGQGAELLDGNRGDGLLTDRTLGWRLLEDHQGGLWFALSHGLLYLPPDWPRFSTYRFVDGQPIESLDLMRVAVTDEDAFLAAGFDAIYRFEDDMGIRRLLHVDDLDTPSISALHWGREGRLWTGHARGYGVYDTRTGAFRYWPIHGGDIYYDVESMLETEDGRLWMTVWGLGLEIREADGTLVLQQRLEQTSEVGRFAPGPDGAVWWTSPSGLQRWDGDGFEPVPGAPDWRVHDFSADAQGGLWLAGEGVLAHAAWRDGRLQPALHLDHRRGIPAVVPAGVAVAPGGQVWMATRRGLVLYDPPRDRLRNFDASDGLPTARFAHDAPVMNRDGLALVLSEQGPVLFDADQRLGLTVSPPLVVNALDVRRGDGLHRLDPDAPIVLGPDDRDFRVDMRLMSFADTHAHRYRFRLEGYDPDWVLQRADGERVFSRLEPGSYLLEVQAAAADGMWSPPRSFELRVRPPWWRTAWAVTGYALALLAVLALLARLYWNRLQRRNAMALAEQERRLALEASQAKSRFLATMGHEIRTPLTGVLGMSELLMESRLEERERGYAEAIHGAGEHLLRLVNDGLDLARIEAGKLPLEEAAFDLKALVEEVCALLRPQATRKGVALVHVFDPALAPAYRGDAQRLRQVMLNLGHNAVAFTREGSVAFEVAVHDEGLCIRVRDTGPGMNAEQRARLFERFARTERHGGSGLGLSISQELVQAMGGRIEVESETGAGTCFHVHLPLPPEAAAARAEARAGARGDGPLRILLVEDDPVVAQVLIGLLEAQGHRVEHATQAMAALSLLGDQDGTGFDLAFIDLDLPGVSGQQLAGMLRVNRPGLPMVALTARADAEAEPEARQAGMDLFVRKPVTGRMLAQAIARVRGGDVP